MSDRAEKPAKPRRICRTVDEAFQAGWDDSQRRQDRPLSPAEIDRIAALWRPYYKPDAAPAAG